MRSEETVQHASRRRRQPSAPPPTASERRGDERVMTGRFAELDAFSEEVARRSLHLLIPGHEDAGGDR